MNPKITKYLLLGGVLLIWGIIIYRVVKGLGNNETVPVVKKKLKPLNYSTAGDSFILYANYADPFLHDKNDAASETKDILPPEIEKTSITQKSTTKNSQPAFDINSIQYLGMIYNPDKKTKIAFIRVGGKEYTVQENDVVEGVLVKKIFLKKINLIFNSNNLSIKR